MSKSHKSQLELNREIEIAKTKISIGQLYSHYKSKDKIYRVIGIGFLEHNDEICVIYNAKYGEQITFIRPLNNWLEKVEWKGNLVLRFSKV